MKQSKVESSLVTLKLAPVFLSLVSCLTLPSNSTTALEKSLIEKQTLSSQQLIKSLLSQNQPTSALEISERSRNRVLVNLLAQSLPTKNVNAPTSEVIKQVAKTQDATLVQYSLLYQNVNVAGKRQTQASDLVIWVINPTGKISLRQVNLKAWQSKEKTNLADAISQLQQSHVQGLERNKGEIRAPEVKQDSSSLARKQLHELLIQPISDLLPNKAEARVIFIPQDKLFLVPFVALQDSNNQYLIEKHTISTAPSIQALDLLAKRRTANTKSTQDVLIVGNPTMPTKPLNPGEPFNQLSQLPGAEKEAKNIASIYNTEALIGDAATETTVVKRMSNARLIHLATSGFLGKSLEIPGFLAFAPSSQDDGWLTATEVSKLKLKAELVILSSCDSALGKITGDGVIGLSRAFLVAGANSVIASSGNISDESTATLMTEFHSNLAKNLDKAAALRQAMLVTMKKYPNPQDWGMFTLVGLP
ncbi:CHAT domain-containing protein [Tolypothrix sp. PCC 7910]|uniref:CHAT domain-containing protein n=1 Tax=Tolypothrix sp. PCC 7910 TaxID=2099387 RepID=UPI00142789E9|nr:CHAT domain-containing protein [Tolypothrix sp. PCC 7910]QIR36267.1 CHAT domain-containing protein [Tolypothrix sp. PCC 7910]